MIEKEILRVVYRQDEKTGLVIVQYHSNIEISTASNEIEALKNAIIMLNYLLENLDKP